MNGARNKKHKLYDPIYMKRPEKTNPQRQKVNEWFPGAERKRWGVTANRYRASFWG